MMGPLRKDIWTADIDHNVPLRQFSTGFGVAAGLGVALSRFCIDAEPMNSYRSIG